MLLTIKEAVGNINQFTRDTQSILLKLQYLTDNITNDYTKLKSKLNFVPIIASLMAIKSVFNFKDVKSINYKTLIGGTSEAISRFLNLINVFKKR